MSSVPRATNPIQFHGTGDHRVPSIESNQNTTTLSQDPKKPSQAGVAGGFDDLSFLRLPEVKAVTGLSKSSLYVLIREKKFPAPVRLAARTVAWVRSEVNQWAAERVHASRSAA
jgi:prophage regulatory protein